MKRYIPNYKRASLCSRDFDDKIIQKIKKEHKNPIIFISVGRSVELQDSIIVSEFPYDFIVTEGIKVIGDNVYYLPKETNDTNNYIAASDYIISKAGFGTLSEIFLSRRKVALLSRDTVMEDKTTISILKKRGDCIEINASDINNIPEIVKKLDNLKPDFSKYTNDYKKIAEYIISCK